MWDFSRELRKTRMHSRRMSTTHSSSRLLGGVYLSACWDTPQVLAWRPPSVGLETPPRCGPGDLPRCGPEEPPRCGPGDPARPDPSTSLLGVGLETLPGQTSQLPPWVWAWRPAMYAGISPPPPP